MLFRTPYGAKRWKKDLDPGGGKIIVELAGYIPVQKRIENIMDAGHRLVESRTAEAYYHFKTGEEIDLDFEDITMRKGYDVADAVQDQYAAELGIKAEENRIKQASIDAKKAAEASKNLSKGVTPSAEGKASTEA